jgi:methylphosphotriester-DNA--protein-cysteine methyltransferase
VAKVLKAVKQLENSGQPVTPPAIAGILQCSVRVLTAYPQVKAILEQVREAEKARTQRIKQQLREDELLQQIEEAIYYLESSGKPVTQKAVSQVIHVSPSTFRRYPRIQIFWAQVIARRNQEKKVNEKLREEMLLKQAEKAVEFLEEGEQPVTHRAVQSFIGVSRSAVRKYPALNSLIASFSKSMDPRESESRSALPEERRSNEQHHLCNAV